MTKKDLEKIIRHWQQNGFGLWVFQRKDDGHFIGRGGLQKYRVQDKEEIASVNAVMSNYWGQGYATEMSHASLYVGFKHLGLENVATWTLPFNKASQRLMEKVGFKYERDFVYAGLPHMFYRIRRDAQK